MRKVTAAAAVALAATANASKASSSICISVFVPDIALQTRGGASFQDNDKQPSKSPRQANKKKKRASKNKASRKAETEKVKSESSKSEAEDESESPETESATSARPSPQESLIQELLQTDDYYEILGVPKTATATQIQKAYRRRAVQTHPDKVANNDRRAFDKVAEAYDVLSDETKRTTYNRFGKRGLDPTSAEGRPPSSFTEDLFKNFFTSQYRTNFKQQQPRNRTVRYQLEVTLEELYNGVDKNVIVTDPGRKKVQVSIEKGMFSGQAIVLSGEMDHISDATPADLVFVIQQRPHPHFTRKGHDLAMELTISLREAVCGMTRTIRHLDGRLVSISSAQDAENNVSMLIQAGDVHVLTGEGMPKPGERDAHGDLYVQYKVEMPTQEAINALTNEEREQLGELLGKVEGDKYYQSKRGENEKNVRVLQKASPADFGRASGPFRVETEDLEEEAGRRGFPFGAGPRPFHFSTGTRSFFGGTVGGRPHDDNFDDDGSNVQCQQM